MTARARLRAAAIAVLVLGAAACDEHIPPDLSGDDGGSAEVGSDAAGDSIADVASDVIDAADATDAPDASMD